MTENNNLPAKTEFLIYQTSDGRVRIETRLQQETVWLNQKQMAELFQTSVPNINIHVKNIFKEQELMPDSVIKEFLITADDGKNYRTKYYNLDLIISVGYRIKSHVATHFRQWATQRLREYIIKGFTMDDERLKQSGGGSYFDELLARIRDIRSSEKVFWRKVLDIYSTSIDYDPKTDVSKKFFMVIQNKMHWAAHGHTAAEVIYNRADAAQPHMGMTNWPGESLKKMDVEVAKNYLNQAELDILNRIVSMYLDFAELQALNRKPMTMRDWITKLDEFMKLTGRDILTHAGCISHDKALEKAHEEYNKYRQEIMNEPSTVEEHFIEAEQELKQLESKRGRKRKDC
ncbi:virulence RhuM family protein [Candidatus Magnetominusculus xianensis]|uniref:Toxin Fic n=1 Tax=Candidatus Magnetominusculus xianensis TaxID=1748249 RepID=A0ABR5SMT6_9BACT|nr:virulence RhuM family protein [Candidatus Magnetominusculus xianensis]KWT92174.1 toxin Fic [Candidatus Magnetominusculus xianensis]MBF0404655.1 virulence RhuM family protein [Nitrospirota bacterium]